MQTIKAKITIAGRALNYSSEFHDLIAALDGYLKRQCLGSCVGVVEPGSVFIEANCGEEGSVRRLLEAEIAALAEKGVTATLVIISGSSSSEPGIIRACRYRTGDAVKMTKAVFFNIPTGYWVVSNLTDGERRPVFAEAIIDSTQRSSQWSRVCALGCSQRLCYVFDTKNCAMAYIDRLGRP